MSMTDALFMRIVEAVRNEFLRVQRLRPVLHGVRPDLQVLTLDASDLLDDYAKRDHACASMRTFLRVGGCTSYAFSMESWLSLPRGSQPPPQRPLHDPNRMEIINIIGIYESGRQRSLLQVIDHGRLGQVLFEADSARESVVQQRGMFTRLLHDT